MNAAELKSVVQELSDVTSNIATANGYTTDVASLNRIRHKLDQHRLAMEAVETDKQPDLDTPEIILESRLERIEEHLANDATALGILNAEHKAIEKRLGEIEAAALEFANAIAGVD
jgi:hypothetical protein